MRTRTMTASALALAAALAISALTASAASGAAAPRGTSPYAPRLSFPMTLTTPAGTIHLAHPPTRIVSLSPTATEILYAIGAGKQVVAVDDDSNYPKSGLPTTRFNAFSPNVEQLIAMSPQLVVVSYNPSNLEAQLAAAGIPVMEQDAPANYGGTLQQITYLGDATGHYAHSLRVAKADRADILKDIAKIPAHHRAASIYYELSPPPYIYAAASDTFVGQLLKSLGVTNIADPASNASNGGYPSLTDEYVISASPKLIFLADTICCKQSYATVAARPGWKLISAVKHHFVVRLNDDIASRWGPRVSILMDQLTAAVLRYDRS